MHNDENNGVELATQTEETASSQERNDTNSPEGEVVYSLDAIRLPNGELPVEADYDEVKNAPNKIWFKYEVEIMKIAKRLGYRKNFDADDLYQQAYIYFIEFCKVYDPYYMGNFIPFDRYIFKNLIIRLRAYIQSYYFKRKREQPTELLDFVGPSLKSTSNEADDHMYVEYIYEQISERQKDILNLSSQGYKQQEIGDTLNISQSRVSVIKKKTLKKLKDSLKQEYIQ